MMVREDNDKGERRMEMVDWDSRLPVMGLDRLRDACGDVSRVAERRLRVGAERRT